MAEEEQQIDDKQVSREKVAPAKVRLGRRVQKIGIVASDKMTKTVVVRVRQPLVVISLSVWSWLL